MSWHVFGGEYNELYEALVRQRCINDGLPLDAETLARQFRLHLHRGVSYLSGTNYIRSIRDLIGLALEANADARSSMPEMEAPEE
jgi:DNA sulfur modification protein DndE